LTLSQARWRWRDSSKQVIMKTINQIWEGERGVQFPAGSVREKSCTGSVPGVGSRGHPGRIGIISLILLAWMLMTFPARASVSVTLAWNPSTNPLVAGYNVYYGGVSGSYTNKVKVGNTTNATVSGLLAGLTYYFAASTYSAAGLESPLSGEVAYFVPNHVLLVIQAIRTLGLPVSISITTAGPILNVWTLQSSTDLKTWTTVARGTNLSVNVLLPVNGTPLRFFRLVNQ
jgi:hypothetical protein